MRKKKNIETNMKYSLISSIALLLTIACTSITQARPRECGCGLLDSDDDEIVVKVEKAQNPLINMPSEEIDKAPVACDVAESSSTTNKAYFPKRNIVDEVYDSSSSSIRSSTSKTVTTQKNCINNIAYSADVLRSTFKKVLPISDEETSASSCGCGKKLSESLEIKDQKKISNQGKIVPSFEPIGDMCYPEKSAKVEITTKVTPAHPGKIKYSSVPSKICLKVVNGKIDPTELKKLGPLIAYSTVNALGFGASSYSKSGAYTSSNAGNVISEPSNFGSYASNSASSLGGYGLGNNDGYSGSSSSSGILGKYGLGGTNNYGGYSGSSSSSGSFGGYSGSSSSSGSFGGYGLGGTNNYGGYSGSSSSSSSFGKYGLTGINNFGGYGGSSSISSSFGKYGSSDNADAMTELTETGSNCDNFNEDYSYPRLPADPVSLALAYKNFFPQSLVYKKKFVPEDKLAFGHRTLPIEAISRGKVSDIPEEKLQVFDKAIVELKPISPLPVTVGTYNEQEEAKLAELEAIERERIKQEEMAEQQQGNVITYRDLGYTPINAKTQNKFSRLASSVTTKNVIDTEESDCGPVGPSIPGYTPGSVVIHQRLKQ